jgi:hypothetical protein
MALAGAPGAHAQAINRCRIDGHLVLQSTPCPIEARSGGAGPAATATATPSAPHKKTLAELLRARDGGAPPPSRAIQIDGSRVLRSRMGAV